MTRAPDPAEVRALELAREAVAKFKDADGATHTAAGVRAGQYDDITEVRYAYAGALAALASATEAPPVAGMGEIECGHCGGVGDIDNGDHSCMKCGGSGRLPAALTKPTPPASVTNGQQYDQDYTPGADKAREIVSWIESGETRNRVYRLVRDALNAATPSASVSGEGVTQEDVAFLNDLAARIFRHASPSMGFDQGDTDQLYALARRLAAAPEAATPSAVGGVDRMREADHG